MNRIRNATIELIEEDIDFNFRLFRNAPSNTAAATSRITFWVLENIGIEYSLNTVSLEFKRFHEHDSTHE